MRKLVAVVLLTCLVPLLVDAAPEARPPAGPNVVLITIDTLRADRLSCYGYTRRTSPHIDRLASQGTLFRSAYTPIPLTGPAHISLMTSLYPQQHGATINGMRMTTKPRPITLAQILHRAGYRTAAFVSGWPVKKEITGLGRGFGVYNQKFTYHYKLVNAARTAEDVTTPAQRWLRKRSGRPFFLWLHYFDPHAPYELHPEFADLRAAHALATTTRINASRRTPEQKERDLAYDSEIAYTDHCVGQVLQLLADLKLRGRTLIILTADHGESLGENGYVGHGDRLYQPIVHIPLILSYPGVIPAGRIIDEDAGLLDLMPTILDYVGIPLRLPLEGRSLKPLIGEAASSPQDRTVYFLTYSEPPLLPPRWLSWIWRWAKTKMTPSWLGFAKDRLKVVLEGEKRMQVYRLDPASLDEHTVDQTDDTKLHGYRQQVNLWFQDTNRGLKPQGKLSQEDLEMLRSIGYVNP